MDLADFVDYYAGSNDISTGYEEQLRTHVRLFLQSIGNVHLADITAEHVNHYLKQKRQENRSDSYLKSARTHLLVVLREARRRGKAPSIVVDDVMRVRVRDRVTRGYTIDEMRRLITAAEELPEYRPYYLPRSRVVRRDWWVSFLAARWDTGADTDTLLSLEREWIPPSGWLTVIRPKTGKRVRLGFHGTTLAAIDANMATNRRLIWPLHYARKSMDNEFSVIRKRAGLPGSLKWTRAGSGSNYELLHPGRGHQHLGNTRQVFERNYLIDEVAHAKIDLPESLTG